MHDRLLRHGLLQSERWLSPTLSDTDRIVYLNMLMLADDFGNLEGGLGFLFRNVHHGCGVKTHEGLAGCLSRLADQDLIRPYQHPDPEGGPAHAFVHLPRFRSSRSYFTMAVLPSPWDHEVGTAEKKVVIKPSLKSKLANNFSQLAKTFPNLSKVFEGVGVGVGVKTFPAAPSGTVGAGGEANPLKTPVKTPVLAAKAKKRPSGTRKAKEATTPSPPAAKAPDGGKAATSAAVSEPVWTAYAAAYKARYNVDPVRNATVNAQVSNLIKRLGAADAPLVAAFFVGCADEWAKKQGHVLGCLLNQCERYRTLWKQAEHATVTRRAETVEAEKGRWEPPPAGVMARLSKVAKGMKVA